VAPGLVVGVLFGKVFSDATPYVFAVGVIGLALSLDNLLVQFFMAVHDRVFVPILFAAGMSLMDTADGAFMAQAYNWAFSNPIRKVFYNLTITGLSVGVALFIGTVELLQVLGGQLHWSGGLWNLVANFDLNKIGFGVVLIFVVVWAVALVYWRASHVEERWTELLRT